MFRSNTTVAQNTVWSMFVSHHMYETCRCGSLYCCLYSASSGICLFCCRLTKAQRASLSSWWRCLGRCSRRSQSWSIPRVKTETWRRSCCRWLKTLTVELLCSKVRTTKHVNEWGVEGREVVTIRYWLIAFFCFSSGISSIVKTSSITQSLKGIATAGRHSFFNCFGRNLH